MKLKIFYPNYDNSISGIPNAILHHYGFKTETRGLPPLDKALSRHPKNVIFLITYNKNSPNLTPQRKTKLSYGEVELEFYPI